jgi:hypothetical protein
VQLRHRDCDNGNSLCGARTCLPAAGPVQDANCLDRNDDLSCHALTESLEL